MEFGGTIGRKGWWYLDGIAPAPIARVSLRYRTSRVLRRSKAVITRVDDPVLLGKLVLKRPFVWYSAEVSPHARRVRMVARNRGGRVIERFTTPDLKRLS
jgi:hypothetical protein